jgi:molecular chaperone GrpE (heat shock protein)
MVTVLTDKESSKPENDPFEQHPDADEDAYEPEKPEAERDKDTEDDAGEIDFDRLDKVVKGKINIMKDIGEPPGTVVPIDSEERCIDELAEDFLHLLQRIKVIEETQAGIMARLDKWDEKFDAFSKNHGRILEEMRRDLLGERKAMASLSTFNAVVPWLDSIRSMRAQLRQGKNKKLRKQLDGLIDILTTMLQSLGFAEFHVGEGEEFNPSRMECTGYAEGEPGVVLVMERCGYHANGIIVRPAGVRIGDPSKTRPEKTEEEKS